MSVCVWGGGWAAGDRVGRGLPDSLPIHIYTWKTRTTSHNTFASICLTNPKIVYCLVCLCFVLYLLFSSFLSSFFFFFLVLLWLYFLVDCFVWLLSSYPPPEGGGLFFIFVFPHSVAWGGGGRGIGSFLVVAFFSFSFFEPRLHADLWLHLFFSLFFFFLFLSPVFSFSSFSLSLWGVGAWVTRLTPHTYIYIKWGMVLRAFIIIRNYNNSIIISVIKHTGEDKDNLTQYICQQQHPLSNKLKLSTALSVSFCFVL